MILAQLKHRGRIVAMLASDYEIYKESKFSTTQMLCEYTKTGRIKKNSEYRNEGVEFIKYIYFNDLHIEIGNEKNVSYMLHKIHDKIKNGVTFNLASSNWLISGLTKEEGDKINKASQNELQELNKNYGSNLPSMADTIIEQNLGFSARW
jgi:hypothetical protein